MVSAELMWLLSLIHIIVNFVCYIYLTNLHFIYIEINLILYQRWIAACLCSLWYRYLLINQPYAYKESKLIIWITWVYLQNDN